MPNNRQPSLTLTRAVVVQGLFPSRDNPGGDPLQYLGAIRTFGFNFTPEGGSDLANGQTISIASNTALFSLLGTTYGGNGQTTFRIPNLGGRVAVNQGQGPGLDVYDLGGVYGSDTLAVVQFNLPADRGGSSLSLDNVQPTLATRWVINVSGIFPSAGSGGTSVNILGAVTQFAGNFDPPGTLQCDGRLLAIAEYETLFQLIGTTYGGDGQSTFALPDLRGRTIIGAGNGLTLGEVNGTEDITLINANLPGSIGGSGQTIGNQGPGLVLNYLVALQGIFPSRDGGLSEDTAFLGEIIAFAGGFAPRGYALAEGQLLAINTNQALFSLFGTQFGGNGTTTFALPDLRGRSVQGSDATHPVGLVEGNVSIILASGDIPALLVNGTANIDALQGSDQADTINGLGNNDTLRGYGGNDNLNGGDGDDTLFGGSGNNALNGGNGVDTASYANSGAVIIRAVPIGTETNGSGGVDTYTDIENFIGSAFNDVIVGGGIDNRIDGGLGIDDLVGGGGNDILIGGSGSANTLQGGLGDDNFIVSAGDTIIEALNAGTDTVQTALASFVLAANVENLTYTGSTGFTGVGNAIGNAINGAAGVADALYGLDGTDTLNGGTGAGNTLVGGLSGDLYVVSSAGDTLVELAGEGIDAAQTGLSSFTLPSNVENLFFLGVGASVGIGNAENNTITALTGADTLSGLDGNDILNGGAGAANTLIGGNGNDRFIVAELDTIIELAGGGTDTVETTRNLYVLGNEIENLIFGGVGAFVGIGNNGDNAISGGGGNDSLYAGAGVDTLTGGNGADYFLFTGAGGGIDVLTDFNTADDRILLNGAVYAHTSTWVLVQGAGPQVANSANSTFLYDNLTGLLSYDADGNGVGLAVVIANLGASEIVTAGDFAFY